jgi:hypothetical protein
MMGVTRRAVLGAIGFAGVIRELGARAAERVRPWRAPRVERGWVLADGDR